MIIGKGPPQSLLIATGRARMMPILQHKRSFRHSKRVRQPKLSSPTSVIMDAVPLRMHLSIIALALPMMTNIRQIPRFEPSLDAIRMPNGVLLGFCTADFWILSVALATSGITHFAIHIVIASVLCESFFWELTPIFSPSGVRFIPCFQLSPSDTGLSGWCFSPFIDFGFEFFFVGLAIALHILLAGNARVLRVLGVHAIPFIIRHQGDERQWGDEFPQVLQNLAAR